MPTPYRVHFSVEHGVVTRLGCEVVGDRLIQIKNQRQLLLLLDELKDPVVGQRELSIRFISTITPQQL